MGVDIPLADISGDGYPDLAIGRLPAQTPAALEHMINRIKIHEASDYWKNKILMVSDRESNNAFQQVCGRLASRVSPDMSIQYLHHTFAKSTDAMKKDFIRGFNSGVLFSIYVGHANNIGMSSPYFFTHSAAESCMPSLTNLVKTPVMLAGACMANDFSEPHPDSRCLGKGFMDTAPGGAVAVWGLPPKPLCRSSNQPWAPWWMKRSTAPTFFWATWFGRRMSCRSRSGPLDGPGKRLDG